nr:carboxypeptidase regulatory-like domain-containing protein [Pleionea sp. CnH1-48]
MDAVGNIAVAYSASSSSSFPSLRFSGRQPGDAANTLTVPETVLKAGEGSQSGANRWGDYSSLSVDPSDDCTFWYTTEYYKAANNGSTAWSTYIGSFKFPNCVAGPSGTVSGTVTDSASGDPIAGAVVTVGATTVITDADGNYELRLPVGDDYAITFFKYGWLEGSNNDVDVAEDAVVDVDAQLNAANAITVTGSVTDGSGLGGSLYAEIRVNAPGTVLTTHSNPVTGQYSIDLFEGTLVKLTATAMVDGYLAQEADILPENTNTQNFALMTDSACIAPGYALSFPSFTQKFDSGVPPTGWTVVDDAGNGAVWGRASATSRGNILNTEGEAAAIDSDAAGNVAINTSLVSPVINVADIDSKVLNFVALFRTFTGADSLDVELNIDNGGWNSVYSVPSDNSVAKHEVDLTAQLAGATSFQLRWRYYDAFFEWYAYVDDIQFGDAACMPQQGTMAKGFVIDANTGDALNGATVTAGSNSVMTAATANDANLNDGYFSIFVPATEDGISVARNLYSTKNVATGDIAFDTAIELDAGRLSAPETASFTVTKGRASEDTITLENTGSADAQYFLLLTEAPEVAASKINGPFHPSSRHFGPKNLQDINTKKIRDQRDYSKVGVVAKQADLAGIFGVNGSFGIAVNQNTGDFWLGDAVQLGAPAHAVVRFDSTGNPTTDAIDTSAITFAFGADIAFNNRTGMLWQVAVGDPANCIHELNPTDMTVTGNTICPAVGTSQRGLTFDPVTNTFYSGSWNDSIIHQFTTDGTILRSVNVGLNVAGLALNPSNGRLYVQSNVAAPAFDVVVLDSTSATMAPIEAFNYPSYDVDQDGNDDDLMPDNSQAGLAIGCDGKLWGVSMDLGGVIGLDTGDNTVCDWKQTNGFVLNTVSGTIAANSTADVALGLDASALEEGQYKAQLIVGGNTPYGDQSSIVTLDVTPPQYGSIQFGATEFSVNAGETARVAVNRVDGSDFAVSVDYVLVDGSATAGTHYTATNGTVSWADGDTSTKYIEFETNETKEYGFKVLNVALVNAQGASIGQQSTKVTIRRYGSSGSFGFGLIAMVGLLAFARRRVIAR